MYKSNTLKAVAQRKDLSKRLSLSPKTNSIPEFQSEAAEQQFWASHDSTEFIDWTTAKRRKFPNLKPTLRTISLRLPVSMIEDLKILANKRDIPYQSLLKVFLAERLKEERRLLIQQAEVFRRYARVHAAGQRRAPRPLPTNLPWIRATWKKQTQYCSLHAGKSLWARIRPLSSGPISWFRHGPQSP